MVASYAFPIVLLPCLAIRVGNALGLKPYCHGPAVSVLPAGAGLLDASARQHGFGGIRSDETHRPRTRSWSRACMPCACKV